MAGWIIAGAALLLAALYLATQNMARLPDEVGINLLASGEYQFMVSKGLAVMVPLAITGGCLLLVFVCRKILYPWLISVFTLVLPILLIVTSMLACV